MVTPDRYNDATATLRAIHACPHIPATDKPDVARRMITDALDVVGMVRDVDPRETWGTLALWAAENPIRLYAATVALACMVDIDRPVSDALAWTDALAPESDSHAVELRRAHAAYVQGSRAGRVCAGEREYQREKKRAQRRRLRPVA